MVPRDLDPGTRSTAQTRPRTGASVVTAVVASVASVVAAVGAPVALLLAACASTQADEERFRAERLKAEDREQQRLLLSMEKLYWAGGEEFDAAVAKCYEHPATAQKLAMLMTIKLRDTEALQRRKQGVDFQLRTLEDNVPYTRARATIVQTPLDVLVPLLQEMVQSGNPEERRRGIDLMSRLPALALPEIKRCHAEAAPKHRRHYVEAVAAMRPCPESELVLLQWSRSDDFTERAGAIAGLSRFGDRHLQLLRQVARSDPDPFVQRQAVMCLDGYSDRQTAEVIVDFYARSEKRSDRAGVREAERALVRMSKLPASDGKRLIHYGLAHWQAWLASLPADGVRR